MKKLVIAIFIGFTGIQISAADLVIAPPNELGSGCDLSVAGFDSKEPFLRFFEQLRAAAAKRDKTALANLMLYPMQVNGTKSRTIRTPLEFSKSFDALFTSEIQSVIAEQQLDRLFCRDQGVMYGAGSIWVGIDKGKVGIITLNLPPAPGK